MSDSPPAKVQRQPDLWLSLGLLLAVGAMACCLLGARTQGLEYDELWTLQHYARNGSLSSLFEDLSTPNNHPLHSLFVRVVAGQANSPEWWTRIPSLLAGCAIFGLAAGLAYSLTRSRVIQFLVLAWCASNPALLHFIQVARGYAIQTAFVTGCAWLLVLSRNSPERDRWQLAGAVICGWAAVLTIPTALMFIGPIFAGDFVCRYWERRRTGESPGTALRKELKIPGIALIWLVPTATWLWHVRTALAEAQVRFGGVISSSGEWADFSGTTLFRIFGWPALILLVIAFWLRQHQSIKFWLAGVLILPFVFAPIIGSGPSRVYVPLIPLGLVVAAIGLAELLQRIGERWRNLVVIAAACLPMLTVRTGLAAWTPTDWRAIVPELQSRIPPEIYICYPASSGYVVGHYYGGQLADDMSRRTPAGNICELALVENDHELEGVDLFTASSQRVALPESARVGLETVDGLRVALYRAEAALLPGSNIVVVAIGPGAAGDVRTAMQALVAVNNSNQWLGINGLLNPAIIRRQSMPETASVLLVSAKPLEFSPELKAWANQHRDQARCYFLAP